MGRPRFVCEYCNKSFEDSHEARQRHNRGRNHKANVKLWYDSFAAQERHAAAATSSSAHAQTSSGQDPAAWTPASPTSTGETQEPTVNMQNLPPSMHPAPPGAFFFCRSDWG